MARKRLTQIFPFLIPIRTAQRRLFFYTKMYIEKTPYAVTRNQTKLPYFLFEGRENMINEDSGFDIKYQHNKAYNLGLATAKLNGMLIQPGETLSLCLAIKDADKEAPYKDGLSLVNGEIIYERGGGLCQLSNLLYWVFLHSPLTVTERHGHESQSVKPANKKHLAGIDATIAEGWLDLKARNDTVHTYQVEAGTEEGEVFIRLLSDAEKLFDYHISNGEVKYIREREQIIEEAEVVRQSISVTNGNSKSEVLYQNRTFIGYDLPESVIAEDR